MKRPDPQPFAEQYSELEASPRVRFLCGIPVGIGFFMVIISLGNLHTGYAHEQWAILFLAVVAIAFFGYLGWHGRIPAQPREEPLRDDRYRK